MINKKAVGYIGAIGFVLLFIVMWFLWLGKWISEVGLQAIDSNGLTGIEAFLYANINIIIMVCLFLFLIGFVYFGAQAE